MDRGESTGLEVKSLSHTVWFYGDSCISSPGLGFPYLWSIRRLGQTSRSHHPDFLLSSLLLFLPPPPAWPLLFPLVDVVTEEMNKT